MSYSMNEDSLREAFTKYGEGSSGSACAVGGYGNGNIYGISNGGFAGETQFGGNHVVGISSQFGGDNNQFGVGGQDQDEMKTENGAMGGDFEDDTDVAKRA